MAQNKAVYRRPDGIVIIDPVKAKGQKQIVVACPYRVIEWNEEKQVAAEMHPVCASAGQRGEGTQVCGVLSDRGAWSLGTWMTRRVRYARLMASGKTEALHPEYGMKEKVRYISLPKKFVAGTVIYGDIDECAGGWR